MSARIDLLGQRFGAWTVIGFAGANGNGQTCWHCRCDCGTERDVVAQTLREGLTKSCGCQKGIAIARARTKHGRSNTKGYWRWAGMIARCTQKNHAAWKYYGGRGIRVCERWLDFQTFLANMGEPPTPKHSIDRIHNDGNYEPGNCRWATAVEQIKNRRKPKRG